MAESYHAGQSIFGRRRMKLKISLFPDAIRAGRDEIAALGDGEEAEGRLDPIAHLIEGARASGSEER